MFRSDVSIVNDDLWMLDAHAHVMQVKLCKANTRGVTDDTASNDSGESHRESASATVLSDPFL